MAKTPHQWTQRSLIKKEPFYDSKIYLEQCSAKHYQGLDPNNHQNTQSSQPTVTIQETPPRIVKKRKNKECLDWQDMRGPQGRQHWWFPSKDRDKENQG